MMTLEKHRSKEQVKKGEKPGLRRVVNFMGLNKHCDRNTHVTVDCFKQVTGIPKCKEGEQMLFNTLDAWNGYHSIEVEKESRNYLTFNTMWGRYRYLNAPQGFLGSGDAYTKAYDEIHEGLE